MLEPCEIMQCYALSAPFFIMLVSNDTDRRYIIDLYYEYRELMYFTARRYFGCNEADIEDAISGAIECMCRYIHKFRAVEYRKIRSYIYAVITNVCKRQLNARNKWNSLKDSAASDEAIQNIPDPEDPYVTVFDYSDAITLLESFGGLSDREKDLIRMRHIEQAEFSEIAKALNMTEGAVRSALTRARRHLQEIARKRKDELL